MPNVFLPAETFAAQCENPRSGTDPQTNQPYTDIQGSTLAENNWLRSWSNHLYLWYDEIMDRDPALYPTSDYFDLLKTEELTPSGNPKDRFHFTYPTEEWIRLAQSGVSAGYGVEWSLVSRSPPRHIVVAYTSPDTPATRSPANLERGAVVLEVDGVDVVNASDGASVDTLNAALFPDDAGETYTFRIQDPGSTTSREVTLRSDLITLEPVQYVKTIDTPTGRVGYIFFSDHIATSEPALIEAVNELAATGIDDLVLDLRYNGGGFLYIASELAYMIAGPVPTAGRTFEELQFNDKHPATNPVTGRPLTPLEFLSESIGDSEYRGTRLPTLNLPRVFVLTGRGTCSASESIMNGLRGVDVEVIQIGGTTCGKPYGFYAPDNCGTTYFSIQFRGVNAMGFGDYADGFTPSSITMQTETTVPGCAVGDDFTRPLGDAEEGRLAAALAYRADGICPAPPASSLLKSYRAAGASALFSASDGVLIRSPLRENRWLDGWR